MFDAERPDTKFADVAGYEGAKEEITEVVDFLRNPGRYQAAGAMAPRGLLMVGPPAPEDAPRRGGGRRGVGAILLGHRVQLHRKFRRRPAGEGTGPVRRGPKRAPAIIFIDEVDAIGQRRAGGARSLPTTSASRR